MAQLHKQYAEGPSGELHGYTGKDAPAGTVALVEEDGKTLTEAGKKYCHTRGYPSPTVEALRVMFDQYHSPAIEHAIQAQIKNGENIRALQEKTKEYSERLRLDWEAQDKAHKANAAKK